MSTLEHIAPLSHVRLLRVKRPRLIDRLVNERRSIDPFFQFNSSDGPLPSEQLRRNE